VLEERSDLPASVGRVIARAMAKLPGNRYQTVAELIEDLTITLGLARFAPVPVQPLPVTPPPARVEEPDEVTVVRTRAEPPPPVVRRPPVTVPVGRTTPPHGMAPAAEATSFNPLKIIIPSVVGLLVVFGVIYALKYNSLANQNQNANQNSQELAADPNSQPVQPGASPTGKGEEGIPAGGKTNPIANVNATPAPSVELSPLPVEVVSPVANANENTNANSNRKAPPLPEPTRSVVPEGVPSPAATKAPEKPSPAPTATPPL
jgi:hypothetical protein